VPCMRDLLVVFPATQRAYTDRMDTLPAEALHASALRKTISAIGCGTSCFLMSHSGAILRTLPFRARRN
jgi:hypothetical protein